MPQLGISKHHKLMYECLKQGIAWIPRQISAEKKTPRRNTHEILYNKTHASMNGKFIIKLVSPAKAELGLAQP